MNELREYFAASRQARVGVILIALAALTAFVVSTAQAQTTRTATISFTKPTKYTDGTDIAASTVLTYNVYQGAKGSTTKPKVGTITGTTTTINSGLQPGETCWQVTAVCQWRRGSAVERGLQVLRIPSHGSGRHHGDMTRQTPRFLIDRPTPHEENGR